ncbi:MAG: VIT1/CCC1 transporter family protein [Gammaproteobacteria bacterium]|nr:VIT1/CCC1 transporter family protein [Gammaproteobacteria bacterium]MBV9620729.1 VIT1/CCC1 transporter family protein [Gammaproteobacteria bacterium]
MNPQELQRLRRNLRDELDGAALYERLAEAERDPVRRDLFRQLAQAELKHADFWRRKLQRAGIEVETHAPSLRTRFLGQLARRFGPQFVMPTIAAAEFADRNKYAAQSDARALAADERGHAAVVQEMARAPGAGAVTGADIAQAEPWHRGTSGNNLRAAVLGANDGLVSNFCLLMAVAGAGAAGRSILLTGLAGLVAGASSMALGEWLSVTNARELAHTQLAREAEEIEQTPQAEQHELALIYQAKGLPKPDAERIAAQLMRDKKTALDTLAREELGIDPQELGGNPLAAALTSFALFATGAVFPVIPFIWLQGRAAVLASTAASAVALSVVGLATSLFNGRGPLFSALRQVLFGCAAAALTYGIGAVLGVSLS